MGKVVHARIDDESHEILRRLRRLTGLSDSELLRQGLRKLDADAPGRRARRVIGAGKFASGVPDLGSNKDRLRGFGRR